MPGDEQQIRLLLFGLLKGLLGLDREELEVGERVLNDGAERLARSTWARKFVGQARVIQCADLEGDTTACSFEAECLFEATVEMIQWVGGRR